MSRGLCDHPGKRVYMNGTVVCPVCDEIDAPRPTSQFYPAPFSPEWRRRMQAAEAQLNTLLQTKLVWP